MARNLYRFYLYIIFIGMLILAAVGLGMLLQPLLALTPLRGSDTIPSNAVIVQAAVFAAVAWIIALALGGLHYWLIRRDLRADPTAGGGGVRAFFLNAAEAVSLPLGVASSASAIGQLGQANVYGIPGALALAIPALGLFALVEWERRRSQAGPGAPIVFQRLHLYGVQLVLLFILTSYWLPAVNQLLDAVVFAGKGYQDYCGSTANCLGPNLLGPSLSTFWVLLFWVGYGFLSRKDTNSLLRQILYFFSFAYGVGYLLYGIERGLEVAARALLGSPASLAEIMGPSAEYPFVPSIMLGLLVIGVYGFWLRAAAGQHPAGKMTTLLMEEAISAALMAATFWLGVGLVLFHVMESIAGSNPRPDVEAWSMAIAFVITGLGYIALDIDLRLRSARAASTGPRRAFVFVLLGSGMLVGAVGVVILLYNVLTSMLGSPVDNWQHLARQGGATFIVGALIVGIYLWAAIQEHLFSTRKPGQAAEAEETQITTKPAPVLTPLETTGAAVVEPGSVGEKPEAPLVAPTIEDILDELQAGKITRDTAAARIRSLVGLPGVSRLSTLI
jgi:hypothetical protein